MITNTELEYKGNLYPNHIVEFAQDTDKIYFTTDNGVVLQITILRGSIIRFRYATNYNFEPDFSYAIDPEATMGYSKLEVVENDTEYIISTARLNILVDKKTLRTQISDLNGTIINEDELGFHWEENYEYGGNLAFLSTLADFLKMT